MDLQLDVTVKASPLKAVLAFMDQHLPAAARDRAFAVVERDYPAQTLHVRRGSVMASERVPVTFVNRLIEATAAELHQPIAEVAHRIGRSAAEEAANGIMRLALTMVSIPNLLRKLSPVWTQLYTHGRMTTRSDKNTATIELSDFPVVSATSCARISGWFEWFAQRAEKTTKVFHSECRAQGGALCRWQVTW